MNILKTDGDDDVPEEEAEAEELEESAQGNGNAILIEVQKDGSSAASAILISGDESETSLAGSFARISLKTRSTSATSEECDSEEEETSPVFLREIAQRHKLRSENFIDRAKSAEKWGDAVAAEKVRRVSLERCTLRF